MKGGESFSLNMCVCQNSFRVDYEYIVDEIALFIGCGEKY